MQINYDISLDIATGVSRKAKDWPTTSVMWSDVLDRFSNTTRTPETVAQYKAMSKSQQADIKDVGGYVFGYCASGLRTQVRHRSALCLDADFAEPDFWANWELLYGNAAAIYSTHKHTPDKPRLRLVIPLSRNVNPDEYQAIGRKVASLMGIDQFDDSSYQPERLMYWPSTSIDGNYVFEYCDGPVLDPDDVLASYLDWTDISTWPFSSRVAKAMHKATNAKQADPLSKPGMVGAFCRAYTIEDAIEKFEIPYVQCDGDRYTYTEGSTAAGVILYENKFSYSHHSTDPASGQLCNAWDLVRIHTFHDMDADAAMDEKTVNLPSFNAMRELAAADPLVTAQIVADRMSAAQGDFDDPVSDTDAGDTDNTWLTRLKVGKNGNIEQTAPNFKIILENDPATKGCIAYDELRNTIVAVKSLPWREVKAPVIWTDIDDSYVCAMLQDKYGVTSERMQAHAMNMVAHDNRYHPIKDYLSTCKWDGVSRAETLLIDYLGAEDNLYTRTVTRKFLMAAVARIYEPGCKFDYMLTMQGVQGKGKSSLFAKMAGQWYSEGIKEFTGKTSMEQTQGIWIGESGELSGMSKSEVEDVKDYISRRVDKFRPAYARRVGEYPRQCVFVGSTNEPTFLRDTENRRFWVVATPNEPRLSQWTDLTPEVVKLIWGEVLEMYHTGETLELDPTVLAMARNVQESFEVDNPRIGIVAEYLDRLLPDNWQTMDLWARRDWLSNKDNQGTVPRKTVCAYEIWCEALNQPQEKLDYRAGKELRDIMTKLSDWNYRGNERLTIHPYGRQKYYSKGV